MRGAHKRDRPIGILDAQSSAVIVISSPALGVLAQFTSKHSKKPKNVVLFLQAAGSRRLTHSQVNLRVKGSG